MEISPVDAQGRVFQLSATEQASSLVVFKKASELTDHGIGSDAANAANVTTSKSYSPAVYAQAAQYQLFSQAGALAQLTSHQQAPPPSATASYEANSEIHAVEASSSSQVDQRV